MLAFSHESPSGNYERGAGAVMFGLGSNIRKASLRGADNTSRS